MASRYEDIHIYIHKVPVFSNILSFLSSHLPYSIPLLRRLQFHGEEYSKSAFVLATFPAPPALALSTGVAATIELAEQQPFAIGFFDRDSGSGTQAWLFSSLELPPRNASANLLKKSKHTEKVAIEVQQVMMMLAHFQEKSPKASRDARLSGTCMDPPIEDVIVVGSLHKNVRDLLLTHPSRCVRDDINGPGGPYLKYIISLDLYVGQAHRDQPLPAENLRFCSVEPSDHEFVMAKNSLVRSSKFLLPLPSCGIRDLTTGQLVAFAFLGQDGSLRTLHVELEWRAKGLGFAVARKLLVEKNSEFTDALSLKQKHGESAEKHDIDSFGLAHGDVAGGNIPSTRLFQKLGAREGWEVFWVQIDLQKVTEYIELDN